jgi:hypothetical protein
VSKERARRRAERADLAARRAVAQRAERERTAARRRRRQRLALAWRRGRLWRRGNTSARTRERRVLIGGIVLAVVVCGYLVTGSVAVVIGVTLVALIATPAIVAGLLDRSNK